MKTNPFGGGEKAEADGPKVAASKPGDVPPDVLRERLERAFNFFG